MATHPVVTCDDPLKEGAGKVEVAYDAYEIEDVCGSEGVANVRHASTT